MTPGNLSFDESLVCVPDFLPDTKFKTLRAVAEQQAGSKRVHIPVHKRGATISYRELRDCAPQLVSFYRSPELQDWCSAVIGEPVQPTPWNDLSSCSLLIYDRPSDHIGWHYDIDF